MDDLCMSGRTGAVTFLWMWAVMMIPMMLPSLVPALRRYRAATGAAIAGFAYFAVWTAVGLAVYPLDMALSSIEMRVPVVAGIVMVIAGAWQFTAWKARRLACCHAAHDARQAAPSTPWRDGLRLGIHCVACCGNLMAGLLAMGMMNVSAMVAVTVAITTERFVPRAARVIGVAAVAAGLLMIGQAASA